VRGPPPPTMVAVSPWDSDRWRRHEMRDYSEGAALENEVEDERPPEETPRDPGRTRPVWFVVLLAFIALAAWLIWVKDNPLLGAGRTAERVQMPRRRGASSREVIGSMQTAFASRAPARAPAFQGHHRLATAFGATTIVSEIRQQPPLDRAA
jgi:hypothetical protein